LEHGAEPSLLLNAIPELKDFNQIMSHQPVTVMDNPSTSVDLTPLQTLIADKLRLRDALMNVTQLQLTVLIATLSPTRDALMSELMLEQLAETLFSQLARTIALTLLL
jgi:hypothetical protein